MPVGDAIMSGHPYAKRSGGCGQLLDLRCGRDCEVVEDEDRLVIYYHVQELLRQEMAVDLVEIRRSDQAMLREGHNC